MKICPLEAELFHMDGKTDMTKLTVAFCNFANATKMTNTVITLVLTFKTIRHVRGHSLARVIISYTHTTLNWTLRSVQVRENVDKMRVRCSNLSPVAGYV